jgi:lipopolysaccharide/colanic/teichoic acid biosynthesis glycosyltransferase
LGAFVTEQAVPTRKSGQGLGIGHRSSPVAELVRGLDAGPTISQRQRPTGSQRIGSAESEGFVDLLNESALVDISTTIDTQLDTQHDTAHNTELLLAERLEAADFVVLPNMQLSYRICKRTIDIVGALLLLLLSAPIILVLTCVIRYDSPGPALFKQIRVTRNGRHFTFYKFRTMYEDSLQRFPDFYTVHQVADTALAFYKVEDDPRNTKVGRWLRRTTLDELPNLFNVLLGDISLVGPRPDLPEFIPHYSDLELSCLLTKAGLTGAAQTKGRSLLTVKERLRLDLNYVSHQSTWIDLKLLLRTVLVVCLGRGAF